MDEASPSATIRPLEEVAELLECEAIQRDVWGLEDRDIVPAAQLRAAGHAGGHIIGAFVAGALVGFAYAFVATPHGRGMAGLGLHSHMVAVLAEARGQGLGRSLKWSQRSWALERGFGWITWTFDPLQARNANLNLRHLGAVCRDYLVDFYGAMPGTLGGGQASDRLLALWLLDDSRVSHLAATHAASGKVRPEGTTPGGGASDLSAASPAGSGLSRAGGEGKELWALSAADVLEPTAAGATDLIESTAERTRQILATMSSEDRNDPSSRVVRIAAPTDINTLLSSEPKLAYRWRLGMRAAMTLSLGAGLTVTAFENGGYSLMTTGKAELRT